LPTPLHFAAMSSDAPDEVCYPSDFLSLQNSLYITQYKLMMYNNLFVGIVYGVYTVLYVASARILLGNPGFTSSTPRMFMFGTTTFMFALGIIALVLETVLGFQQLETFLPAPGNTWSWNHLVVINGIAEISTHLMYILSDVICAWRAVVLWKRDKRVISILLLFILVTTASAVFDLRLNFDREPDVGMGTAEGIMVMDMEDTFTQKPIILVVPTLATNLLSTGLIAWKFWQGRISVRGHLGEGSGFARVDRVFALLIESGFVYCCVWILYLISAFWRVPDQGFTFIIMSSVVPFVAGVYPTLIVILVGMQQSPIENYSAYSAGMPFARASAPIPPRDGGAPRNVPVYTIGREYVSDSDMQVPSMEDTKISGEEKNL